MIASFLRSADECLVGLIPRDFKMRLQIFITWLAKGKTGGKRKTYGKEIERKAARERERDQRGSEEVYP